jgi:hypothetical protein
MRLIFSILIFFSLFQFGLAQSSPNDSIPRRNAKLDKEMKRAEKKKLKEIKKIQNKEKWSLPYPNPYRAGLYSFIIPGAGQIYNKRYWKAPLVWGAMGGMIYLIDFNKTQKERFETAYGLRVIGTEEDEFVGLISSAEGIKKYRDQYDKYLQQSYLGLVGIYALNALEAYVDAHLKNFDISEDLSLRVNPTFSNDSGTPYVGISLTIPLGK